jgi:hypothetical protein
MACAACGGIHMSGETCSETEDQDVAPDLVDDEFNDSKEKFIEEDDDDDEDEEWGDESDESDEDEDDDDDEEEDDDEE